MGQKQRWGVASLFTAAAFYGLYGIFSRLIGSSFGSFNQNWIRNLIVLVLILVVILVSRRRIILPKKQDWRWLLLWFLSGSWVTILTFIAFNHLPIGTTYLVLYSAMIASGFISGKIFFGERFNLTKGASLALALIGLFVIYQFTLIPGQIFYLGLTLVSGFMTGVWNTISKKFSGNYNNNQMVLMDAASSMVVAYIGSLLFREYLPQTAATIQWLWISVYAVVQMINVGLMVYGFKHVEAQIGSIILPVEIIFATLFSYLIFREIPTPLTIVGGLLIIAAAVVPSVQLFESKKT